MGDREAQILGSQVSSTVRARVQEALSAQGGWLGFEAFMNIALYGPGGYYASGRQVLGQSAADSSDFVTAPELSPLFGAALAVQVAQALQATQTQHLLEFGAGSGRLAFDLLSALDAQGVAWDSYAIVEVSPALAQRQRDTLAPWGDKVQWLTALPAQFAGVALGNEVLDAMPVQLWEFMDDGQWVELGIREGLSETMGEVLVEASAGAGGVASDGPQPVFMRLPGRFTLERRMNAARSTQSPWPAVLNEQPMPVGSITETHAQAEAFVRTVASLLTRGAAFFIDYGFPQAEYYHPQRQRGTLVAHQGHRVVTDMADILAHAGEQDITAHVNFTGIAVAVQDEAEILGYTSQARFLLNCGVVGLLERDASRLGAESASALRLVANTQKLLTEHEMGELFKVLAFARGWPADVTPLGFASGDRTHTL